MIDVLYKHMGIPDACQLGKRVFKKLFHENAQLGATDKRAFRDDIDVITWVYTLKPNTIAIAAYEDDQREYQEVAVLQVDAKTQLRTTRIAQIIHRAIPYPVVVVFAYETTCAVSLAHKRFSQAEKGAIVADQFNTTQWFDLTAPTSVHKAFLASLTLADLPHTHFFALYSALVDRVIALDCARLTGQYRVEASAKKRDDRRERLAACHELEVQVAELKAAIKKEHQFNRQVELNTHIKQLEDRLRQQTARL
jgi:uncharacterized protein DUF4391